MSCFRFLRTVLALTLAGFIAGCATPADEHYYRLSYPAAPALPASASYEVVVDGVSIPDALNRPQLVLQKSSTEALIDDAQRWLAPLDEQLGQALIGQLRSKLPQAWVGADVKASQGMARYYLKLQVEQLLAPMDGGGEVVLEANWSLLDGARQLQQRRHALIKMPRGGAGYETVAPAVSAAVEALATEIAQVIREKMGN